MRPAPGDHTAYLDEPSHARWLSRGAFGLAATVVMARAMLPVFQRDLDPLLPLSAGDPQPPRAAGPAAAAIFDSLAILAAILVLFRAALDRRWNLQVIWAAIPLVLVACLAFASTGWAGDKFTAAASASAWLGAAAILFVFAQTARTWARLRIVAGIAAGLLMANVAFGIFYYGVDLPDTVREFERNADGQLRSRGLEPGTFAARNFENRLRQGQTGGFASSPNSYAATLVMLGFVTAGAAWQRWRDRSEPGWAALIALTLLPAAWLLWKTGSRTAMAAALLVGIALAVGWLFRDRLSRRRTLVLTTLLLLLLIGVTTVVGVGLRTGTLPHDSLAFRWNYWVGAWGVWREAPLLGVGFGNFGDVYLAHRLPVAAEEVKDPHNLFIRFFAETGLVGGVLAILWLLAFAWNQARPADRPDDLQRFAGARPPGLGGLAVVTLAAIGMNLAAAVDFTVDPYWAFLETLRRGLYGLVIIAGVLLTAVRSTHEPVVATSPAAALLATVVAGLVAALLHAMVDVVVFEPPVLMSFAMLMGTIMALRSPEADRHALLSSRLVTWSLVGLILVGWLGFVTLFVAPLVAAESAAAEGNRLMRENRPNLAASAFGRARDWSPVPNSDYIGRQALASSRSGAAPSGVEAMLHDAIAARPRGVGERIALARFYLEAFNPPRRKEAVELFREALTLNPNEIPIRLRYADLLQDVGQALAAAMELELALRYNDQLHPDEPERLSKQEVQQIRTRINGLRGTPAQ